MKTLFSFLKQAAVANAPALAVLAAPEEVGSTPDIEQDDEDAIDNSAIDDSEGEPQEGDEGEPIEQPETDWELRFKILSEQFDSLEAEAEQQRLDLLHLQDNYELILGRSGVSKKRLAAFSESLLDISTTEKALSAVKIFDVEWFATVLMMEEDKVAFAAKAVDAVKPFLSNEDDYKFLSLVANNTNSVLDKIWTWATNNKATNSDEDE